MHKYAQLVLYKTEGKCQSIRALKLKAGFFFSEHPADVRLVPKNGKASDNQAKKN